MESRQNLNMVRMECVECCNMFDVWDMLLLWPKRELKLGVHTEEPDFFCVPCANTLGIMSLEPHSIKKWLHGESEANYAKNDLLQAAEDLREATHLIMGVFAQVEKLSISKGTKQDLAMHVGEILAIAMGLEKKAETL